MIAIAELKMTDIEQLLERARTARSLLHYSVTVGRMELV